MGIAGYGDTLGIAGPMEKGQRPLAPFDFYLPSFLCLRFSPLFLDCVHDVVHDLDPWQSQGS